MRILTICAEYPPFFVGGISLHTYELNKLLAGNGFQVWVITFWNDADIDKIQLNNEEGVHVIRIPRPAKNAAATYTAAFTEQNKRMIQGINWIVNNIKEKFELIVIHGYFLAEAAIFAKNILKCPIVYHVHTLFSNFNDTKREYEDIRYAEKSICTESVKIVSVSEYLKELINRKLGIDKDKMTVITKAVDLKKYDEVPNIECEFNKIVYVGRISPEKGIEVVIYALKEVKERIQKPIYLFIIGQADNKEYYQKIKNLIKELGLKKEIVFLGYKGTQDIIREYKNCTLVVVPSYAETFGKVAIEAMAAKVPVIVSDVGGLGPIITDNINGLKFKVGDYHGLAQQIFKVIEDQDFARILSENAYGEVKSKYQWSKILTETISVYKGVIDDEGNNCNTSSR